MRLLIFLCFCTVLVQLHASCPEEQNQCDTTDYRKYVDCVQNKSNKQLSNCDSSCESSTCTSCDECNCSACTEVNCDNSCKTCCNNHEFCQTNHCCHKSCHARCRDTTCRNSCRKTCHDYINKIKDQPNNGSTIINLHNYINNTNNIHTPINLNNSNVNNIAGQEENNLKSNKTNCCSVVGPRQCVKSHSFPFVRCFHKQHQICDEICQADIMHIEDRKVCNNALPNNQENCQKFWIYIPQPQPQCVHQLDWPFVSCATQNQQFCGGCYSHYFDQTSRSYQQCPPSCYDDGYGVGPLYRQGPFFRPTYSHIAPCYQPGDCNFQNNGLMAVQINVFNGYENAGNNTDQNQTVLAWPEAFPWSMNTYPMENDVNNINSVLK